MSGFEDKYGIKKCGFGPRGLRCCLVEEEEAREMLNMWKGNVTLWAWSPVMLPSTDWPVAIAESM